MIKFKRIAAIMLTGMMTLSLVTVPGNVAADEESTQEYVVLVNNENGQNIVDNYNVIDESQGTELEDNICLLLVMGG